MAANTWPTSLPAKPTEDGFTEQRLPNVVTFEPDDGPPKVRRRSTADSTRLDCVFELTAVQATTLDTFYATTLISGTLRFNWDSPRTGVTAEYRFKEPPVITNVGGNSWRATCVIERMP